MWWTYALCEPILEERQGRACNATKLHQRTVSESMKSNDDGSLFVIYRVRRRLVVRNRARYRKKLVG